MKATNRLLAILLVAIMFIAYVSPSSAGATNGNSPAPALVTDTNGPVITVVSCDGTNKALFEGDSIKLTFRLEDPSGIGSNVGILMTYRNPNGEGYSEFIGPSCVFNSDNGLYECVFTVNSTHRIGIYEFAKLHAYDAVGNYSYIRPDIEFYVGMEKQSDDGLTGGENLGNDGDDYIAISTKSELNAIRNNLSGKYYLTNDIVFTNDDFSEGGPFYNNGHGWLPIGDATTPFSGILDGKGYSISGMVINAEIDSNVYIGLFGRSQGLIKNLTISDSNISVSGRSTNQSTKYIHAYIGNVTGSGSVENCHNSGSIYIAYSSNTFNCYIYAGGLTGDCGSAVDCSNSGPISLKITTQAGNRVFAYLGGIAGASTTIEKCKNLGIISASSNHNNTSIYAGGIAGSARTVKQSSNVANITANGNMLNTIAAGGICGMPGSGLIIAECYNTGIIDGSGESSVGGIVGKIGGAGTVKNSYNTGKIDGGVCGGIVGYATSSATIQTCYNTGFIEKGYYKYAMLGESVDTSVIENCYSLIDVATCRSLTTAVNADEMLVEETFTGFDFDETWVISKTDAYAWPSLRSIGMPSDMISISDCSITLDRTEVQYHTRQPIPTVSHNGETLVLNTDYLLVYVSGSSTWNAETGAYRTMSNIGPGYIKIIGIGKLYGIETMEFEVTKYNIEDADIFNFMLGFTYDGREKTQSVQLSDNIGTISSDNYTITYRNNVDVGTATMIITGKGSYYTGTIERYFEIWPRSVQSISVSKHPAKLVYKNRETEVDVSGGEITVFYLDGGVETIRMTADMLENYNLSVGGTQQVWLTYEGISTYFEVTVFAIMRGDCNNDGKITITDMLSVKAHILGKSTLTGDESTAADTNLDGKITITDFIQLKAHILGKSTIEQ